MRDSRATGTPGATRLSLIFDVGSRIGHDAADFVERPILTITEQKRSQARYSLHFVSCIHLSSADYGCISHIYVMFTCGENNVADNFARV